MYFRPVLKLTPVVLFLLAAPALAAPDYATRIDLDAADSVLLHVEHKDCAGAVKQLNKGIAAKYPSVYLIAASMFEQGLCVKPDWDKAALYYQLAHEGGKREALPRLISGYAEKNRDPAAALWWLSKNTALPAPCRSASHLANDPEAFVAALNKWPKGQLAACVYTAGVMMRVSGDVEFPGRGSMQGVFGDAHMHFVPSTGTITWKATGTGRLAMTRDVQVGEDERSVFSDAFLKHMRAVSDRALKQFDRPEGIDPAWAVDTSFSFRSLYE